MPRASGRGWCTSHFVLDAVAGLDTVYHNRGVAGNSLLSRTPSHCHCLLASARSSGCQRDQPWLPAVFQLRASVLQASVRHTDAPLLGLSVRSPVGGTQLLKIASASPSAFKYRSSVQTSAARCEPAPLPMIKSCSGSPPYSVIWSCPQRIDLAMSRTMVSEVRQEPAVGGYDDDPPVGERSRLDLDARLVARLPAAGVDSEHDGQALRLRWRIDVEHLALLRWGGIGDVASDLLS